MFNPPLPSPQPPCCADHAQLARLGPPRALSQVKVDLLELQAGQGGWGHCSTGVAYMVQFNSASHPGPNLGHPTILGDHLLFFLE